MTKRTKTLLGFGVMLTLIAAAVKFENSMVSWLWAPTPWLGLLFLVGGLGLLVAGLVSWRLR